MPHSGAWRILFAGTPEIAVPALRTLAGTGRLVGVLTVPDQVAGRGQHLHQSEVKVCAQELGLPVLQPNRLDQAARDAVAELKPDLLVCIAYGRIFGPKFLGQFPQGGINLHPSLLPKYRGPSPINAAILAGEDTTGISIQVLAPGMDEGDILAQERILLSGNETAGSLSKICSEIGARMLLTAVNIMEAGLARPQAQDGALATYCSLIHKDDGLIDWTHSALEIHRQARAYDPWPRAWTLWQGKKLYLDKLELYKPPHGSALVLPGPQTGQPGQVFKVDKTEGFLIQTGQGLLALRQLQLQSKKSLDHLAFFNGARDFVGTILGE